MKLRVRETSLFVRDLRTRIPFRYGIATLTGTPHLFVRALVEIEGHIVAGYASDNLPPKWFTKNPGTTFVQDLGEMLDVIHAACAHAVGIGESASLFALWRDLYAAQSASAKESGWPPLLAGFGVSLVERAIVDAICKAGSTTFADALRENVFGVKLAEIYPELKGEPSSFLPPEPLREIVARHTVGLTDPLTAADIPEGEHVHDGLPHDLEACVRAYGLTHFKIKLSGNIDHDRARLHSLAELLEKDAPGCRFTLDGNENYRAVAPFRELWEQFLADPIIAHFLGGLIFVEQPLHRDVALTDATANELRSWRDRPPIIIDESDGAPGILATALDGGYAGTSHKNCKGIIKGIANACLISHRSRTQQGLHLSAEDLTNVGPVALLQDLAVIATLGIPHAERNGHHYFAGLSQMPESVQRDTLAAHGDLYKKHRDGWPTLRVEKGKLDIGSVNAAPFGCAIALDPKEFTPIEAWDAGAY